MSCNNNSIQDELTKGERKSDATISNGMESTLNTVCTENMILLWCGKVESSILAIACRLALP